MPNPMELVFTPISPCRAFSQTITTGPDQRRTVQITGGGSFAAQGGSATGCGVPASATAVAISMHVKSTVDGLVTAFAEGADKPPTAFSAYYSPQQRESISVVTQIGTDGKIALNARPTVATAITGDITGYYAPQIAVYMNYNGTAYSATTRILSTSKISTGYYQIDTDRNLQLCSVHVNVAGGFYYATAYPSGNSIYVSTWRIESGSAVPQDLYHNVSAHC